MSDGQSAGDFARAALANLAEHAKGRDAVAEVMATAIRDEDTEAELWARIGRVLRSRDPDGYRQMRGLGAALAALLDAPIEN